VARQNIKLSYDPETGFFGSDVKGSKYQLTVSEYDKILIISKDGSFRIIAPEEKVLIPGRILYLDVFDQDKGKAFTVVYRFKNKMAYAKKVHIKAFIRDREYELIKDKDGAVDYLLPADADDTIHLDFVPRKRQRVNTGTFDLGTIGTVGVTARGSRMAAKPVAKMKKLKNGEAPAKGASEETPNDPDQPSLFESD
jgi:topoisomerase-4 subunit A